MPAVPETIILRGGGLLADWCCWAMVYTCCCFPCRLAGSAEVVNTCCAAVCFCWEMNDGASSRVGYESATRVQSMPSWVSMLGCRSAFCWQIIIHSSVGRGGGALVWSPSCYCNRERCVTSVIVTGRDA